MQLDLVGQVNTLHLPAHKALLPLFEAVVNAIQAIEESGRADGAIEIAIEREATLFGTDNADGTLIPNITAFEIADNGVGFTDRHFTSFDTSYTTLKAHLGGKGVGRLLWLKAFEQARIESVYSEGAEWRQRRFDFRATTPGIEAPTLETLAVPPADSRTVVRLEGFRPTYQDAAPKGALPIGKRLVEHLLVLFMLDAIPRMVFHDPAFRLTLDLQHVYRHELEQSSAARTFSVGQHTFAIVDVLLRASADAPNALHFCANKREVFAKKLDGLIPHADGAIAVDGATLRYAACITSEYLDRRVNTERTGFDIDRDEELPLAATDVRWQEIEDAAIRAAEEFLAPRLEEAQRRSLERIQRFVEDQEPRYRVLLEHQRDAIARISGSLSDDRLELELHKALASWRHEVKREAADRLSAAAPCDAESFHEFERQSVQALGALSEVAKADLAEYVVHRRTVLEFFTRMLGWVESRKFAREEVLHSLFLPRRTTSDTVDYDDHNLWLIDERLVYHRYLASDLPFSDQVRAPISVDGRERPDLVIYQQPLAFAPDEDAPSAIVIVEFKRPERDDYTDEENPIAQVLDYIEQIRRGKARRADGSTVSPPATCTPFYCHIVATLTPGLRDVARRSSFIEAPDRQGFFHYNPNFLAYIELIDYRKSLSDAVKRNKAFFEKLGLHRCAVLTSRAAVGNGQ